MSTQELEHETEASLVWRHRLVQFLVLGYDMDEAELLADSKVDHHELANLIKRGCPIRTATSILL